LLRRPPYRRYIIGSILRGKSINSISACLRNLGLLTNLCPSTFSALATKELLDASYDFLAAKRKEEKVSLGVDNDVGDYIYNCLENTTAWAECWDIISVRKYREYIFILASIPGYAAASITEMFNRKFSRSIERDSIALLISTFWDVAKSSTIDIKTAVDELASETLKNGINKLLFGNAVAAAEVGRNLRRDVSRCVSQISRCRI